MTKQEEIREEIYKILSSDILDDKTTIEVVCDIVGYLHSQGVVIRVDMPYNDEGYNALKAGYVATEPLIENKKGAEK